jgi:hypothetical protein
MVPPPVDDVNEPPALVPLEARNRLTIRVLDLRRTGRRSLERAAREPSNGLPDSERANSFLIIHSTDLSGFSDV